MAGILTLQAVLLGDGGLLALGANVINMGLMPAAVVALVQRVTARRVAAERATAGQQAARSYWTLAATAFGCTVAAAGLIVLEVSIGRSAAQLQGLEYFAARMLAWHAVAGLAEAASTMAIVAVLTNLADREALGCEGWAKLDLGPKSAGLVVAVSLAVAILGLPAFGLASAAPDNYQAALVSADQSGLAVGQIETPGKLAGASAVVQGCQDALAASLPDAQGLLVVLAAVLAGGIAWGCARTSSRARVIGEPLAGCS
jgi:cobalt/nickel transport system permease protein